jgi:hypothetical protein
LKRFEDAGNQWNVPNSSREQPNMPVDRAWTQPCERIHESHLA